MFELSGKVALVTGAGRGIGLAIAQTLARQGASVVLADLDERAVLEEAKRIEEGGARALGLQMDVADLQAVRAAGERVEKEFGGVDILVNNAGFDRILPFLETGPDFWEKIIQVNFKGLLHCAHVFLPQMVKKNKGKLIAISSDAARVGSTGESVYAGTKAGAIAFCKTLARELARNDIQVNIVCPGPTETQLIDDMSKESEMAKKVFSSMERIIPLRRMAKPQDIANAVAFFASSEADYITGQVLSVSGGLTMAG
jgi:2-hydroxycyclohexanecarboxyl-CoA dehydrogenase